MKKIHAASARTDHVVIGISIEVVIERASFAPPGALGTGADAETMETPISSKTTE
jgi:hypothetical protein